MATKKGWKSPDPAKKRRKAKAKKHAAPKAERPSRKGVDLELRSNARAMSMLAHGEAEVVNTARCARPPIPGVVLGGTRSEGRVTCELKDSELWGKNRNDRKTDASKRAHSKRRQSVAFKEKRSAARAAGTYDPSSVGKPAAFSRKRDNPDVTVWRNPDEVPAAKYPVRIRIGRRGSVVVVPTTRGTQDVTPKEHRSSEEHHAAIRAWYDKRFWKSHTLEEFDEPTGKYTAQYIRKVERQIVGYKKILVEEIWKEINGKRRLVGKVHEKGAPIWRDVVVEERVENLRPKTQRKVRIIRDDVTDYSKTDAVKVVRVNPDRLEKRAAKKRKGATLRGKKREKVATPALKAAA